MNFDQYATQRNMTPGTPEYVNACQAWIACRETCVAAAYNAVNADDVESSINHQAASPVIANAGVATAKMGAVSAGD